MKIIKNRLFKVLVILLIVGFFLGIISYFILGKSNSVDYLYLIKSGSFKYKDILINSILNNYKYSIIIWICGIIFIFVFIIPLLIIFRGIMLGYTLFSIIIAFNIKGLLYCLILLFPCTIINELVFLLLSYYSINFSIKFYNVFKNNKLINIKSFSLNYVYILVILNIVLLLSSLFETYISSNIIKFVI